MPRTAEHIVACHELAEGLRRQGRRIWNATFDFKGILPEGHESMPTDLTGTQCIELGRRYAQVIRNHPYVKRHGFLDVQREEYDSELDLLVENFECVSANPQEGETELDDLNDHLDALYDWADMNRVWVTGLGG